MGDVVGGEVWLEGCIVLDCVLEGGRGGGVLLVFWELSCDVWRVILGS